MPRSNFENKFLSKLSKIDRLEIESFLTHLVQEKNFLEVIFDAMVDGIVVLRPSLEVIYANNRAIEILGIGTRRKLVGERITELCPNDRFRELMARFALSREEVKEVELELIRSAGDLVITVTIIPLSADRGHAEGSVIMILHDITETRKQETELRRAERAKAYATLAAGLAHEIKNPLNSLMIHAQLMQKTLKGGRVKKTDSERLIQSSEVVVEELGRLNNVVSNFLAAVRPTRPLVETGNINRLLQYVIATLRPEADERRVELVTSFNHDIPPVEIDPNQMKQVVLNLLKNAFDAVEDKEVRRVEIRTELKEGFYAIHFADNGRGISEEDKQKIFQPYYTIKFSGTGLGLAIVSRIVEEHGGTMEVFSKENEGTVISLLFPVTSKPIRLLGGEQPPPQDETEPSI